MSRKFKIIVSKSSAKGLKKIPLPWRSRIILSIDLLQENPLMGEKLWGKLEGKRKIRIHPYRIIYEVSEKEKTIIILETGHRSNVYK
ncbi:MAG: type II toxin-antitoxin system RelE/ParE family toxin [Patescibacteria group bacterium]